MPIKKKSSPRIWEHGVVKEVTRILNEEGGEDITYDGVAKRLGRRNHIETYRLAFDVNRGVLEEKLARQEEISRMELAISNSKNGDVG